MAAIFFTGFPGFLGSELLKRILVRSPDTRAICLVQPKFVSLATARAAELDASRITIVEGDISQPRCGIALPEDVSEAYHLAAIYDLAVAREFAMRINVDGTRNVLDLVASLPSLRRLHYVSTCYVSGRYDGTFYESDLEKGQSFNNHYEETKYLAEVEVQKRMREGMPVTIYRPAVVVGDSRTGETQKFDGPYFIMQLILRQPRVAFLPRIGDANRFRFNVVPRDFIIDAIDRLGGMPESRGKVYQLADPQPLTIRETVEAIASATGRSIVPVPAPRSLVKASLSVPFLQRWMRVPAAAVDYFDHPTSYDTTNTRRDLGDISVPRLRDYLPLLIEFARAHPEIGSAAMA